MPSNQSKEVSDHTAFENSSLQRSRAMSKLLCGGQQYIEKGYLPLIIYTVTARGKLRKIGDSTFSLLDTEVDKLMLSKLTRSMVSGQAAEDDRLQGCTQHTVTQQSQGQLNIFSFASQQAK